MTINLGVVGPEDSVGTLTKVVEEYPSFKAIPIIYEKVEQAPAKIKQTTQHVDQWLFSGQAPYSLCTEMNIVSKDHSWFVPLEGSSLLGTFLEAFYHTDQKKLEISLDTISPQYTNWLINEFSLAHLTIHLFDYPDYVEEEKLIVFHKQAFQSGKTAFALTCLRGVYQALIQLGIPCYRVKPAEPVTRNILGRIQDRMNSLYYKKAQIGVVGALISFSQTEQKEMVYSYKRKHQELVIRKRLLDYAESLQGSFIEIGNGYFEIFTTRGEIEAQSWPYEVIDDVKTSTNLTIYLGIGYGRTALAASKHVQSALDFSKQAREQMIVLVDEENNVSEAKRHEEPFHYRQVFLGDKSARVAVGPGTIARIYAKVAQQKQAHFSAQDVAIWLEGTERHARRILFELEKGNVIQQVGEEQSGRRGRPRKVYCLKDSL
ncbi:hypothetical protein MM326_09080 [Alkalihalobacillus sp. LMS6]|uniref:hypothetical protein n=1 Tax=Alkalihalobacillus sp. LMS6 TaxID=2924034 RepID=UPI0020CFFAED|nr:hypothetical protein [Alkalihalobacillus sp. LMS6]UTR08148.1 hypothetical protein MM326_09080 [Alkalihalobacillus sp. LMS6]